MSDPPLSVIKFKNKIAWVWTTHNLTQTQLQNRTKIFWLFRVVDVFLLSCWIINLYLWEMVKYRNYEQYLIHADYHQNLIGHRNQIFLANHFYLNSAELVFWSIFEVLNFRWIGNFGKIKILGIIRSSDASYTRLFRIIRRFIETESQW